MIFEKTLMTLAAAAAIAAAAAVGVVAAAFALYAVVIPYVGAAGAAAIVAAVAAVIVGIAALLAARKVESRSHGRGQETPHDAIGIAERVFEIAKERPILSIGAALAAGVFALRNPILLATVAKAFLDTRRPPQR